MGKRTESWGVMLWHVAIMCSAMHLDLVPPFYHRASRHPPILLGDRADNLLVRAIRRLLRREKHPIVCGSTKYGCDPRGPDDFADEDFLQPLVPSGTSFELAEPGVVGELTGGIPHLNALIEDAGMDRAIVLKFMRKGCLACNATVVPLASAAHAYAGRVDFMTVEYAQNRMFCKKCRLAVVPSAHIYVKGQLEAAMPLGPKKWDDFMKSLGRLVGPPDGAVIDVEVPADKNLPDARSVAGLDVYL